MRTETPSDHDRPLGRVVMLARAADRLLPSRILNGDVDTHRRARMLVGLCAVFAISGAATLLFFAWAFPRPALLLLAAVVSLAILSSSSVPVVLYLGSLSAATNVLLAGVYAVIVTAAILLGGMQSSLLSWCAVLPMLALITGARRSAWFWLAASFVTLAAFSGLAAAQLGPASQLRPGAPERWARSLFDGSIWISVLFGAAYLYEKNRDQQTAEILRKNSALEREIAERLRVEARNRYLTSHDELTELPNREHFAQQLVRAMQASSRDGRKVGVLFVDLSGFKDVNETLGHAAGDALLRQVSRRLGGCIRLGDSIAQASASGVVSRLGGSEFTVLLRNIRDHEEAAIVARRILRALSNPLRADSRCLYVTASIGIAVHPGDGSDASALLRNADLAMRHAKQRGRNNYQFFDEELNAAALKRTTIASELREALERGEFVLEYQPIFASESGHCTGVEALVRWRHPRRGLLAPGEFIEIAEQTGLIVPLGAWIVRDACRQWCDWRDQGLPALRLSVNVSSVQLAEGDLHRLLEAELCQRQLPAKTLELEITEGAMMQDEEEASRVLGQLSALGVRIALDDFGTGYSSLSYVKRFPVDSIKIDRSFVSEAVEDPEARAITTAIVAMARGLQLRVVAEGVETQAQARFLRGLGCDELQGFLLGRPVAPAAIADRLAHAVRAQA
jgi:diguanylate cyclase (GGDEF)-like protein